jgi:hypothetical protein
MSENDTEPTGEPKWVQAVILTIWHYCYQQWITWCDHQYGQNQTTRFKYSQLLLQVQAMYSIQDHTLSNKKYIFQTPLEDWNDKTTLQVDDWITKYTPSSYAKAFAWQKNSTHKISANSIPTLHNFLSNQRL